MTRLLTFLAALSVAAVAGCGETLFERGASGAAIGAGTAAVLDEDPLAGAAIGAGVGVITR